MVFLISEYSNRIPAYQVDHWSIHVNFEAMVYLKCFLIVNFFQGVPFLCLLR